MGTLFIKHVPPTEGASGESPRFLVARPDGKGSAPVTLRPPDGYPVKSRPQSDLPRELQWYLETFLEYPFPPNTDRAANALDALRSWGRETFTNLFAARDALQMFEGAVKEGHHELQVQVWSDEPAILSWPWEALTDPQTGFLAQTSAFERRLNRVRDPAAIASTLPKDRVNILLVTARPYSGDVRYRSISRPLVELIEKRHLPARVHVLRPPTFERLREHLRERPGFYHVLHFDGHGAYGSKASAGFAGAHQFQGREGRLVFEDTSGEPHAISADTLSVLLREHAVPIVVLNACQSAMVDAQAADPFASVATALLRAGSRSIVAMAYSLYVSAAQEFLPSFYARLFETGSMGEAVREGRNRLLVQNRRDSARGKFELEDWLVPVLYEQDALDLSFAKAATVTKADEAVSLPDEAVERDSPFGFVGRDGDLLALERALRGPAPAILIHGLGGVGKTTLARGLVKWLRDTEGLGEGCFWFGFQEIRNIEFVLNRIGEGLFGGQFPAIPSIEKKIAVLVNALKEHRLVIVWDNFEVVAGVTDAQGTLSDEDRGFLVSFLRGIRGGASKVIITSRSDEEWIGIERRVVAVGGLEGEERWAYCDRVLEDLGIRVDRGDEALGQLMDLLNGHPLAMRAILPELARYTATALVDAVSTNATRLQTSGDDTHRKLFATLKFVEQSLPPDLRPLLIPLGLHERFVDADGLQAMATNVSHTWTRAQIHAFCLGLARAGLLHDRGHSLYELHPVLAGYLRVTAIVEESSAVVNVWRTAFVDFMAALADHLAPKPLHEQRAMFEVHRASFYRALSEARALSMALAEGALTQALAIYAQNTRAFREAHELFLRLAQAESLQRSHDVEATAYHQLGMVAQEQHDFAAADQWYRRSLAINEKYGDERGIASTYHQLGTIAHLRHDFAAAEDWYRRSLAIEEKLGNEDGAAITYHQLGVVAQERRDFAAAEQWYRRALVIEEKHENEHGAAVVYHQLGRVAEERRDLVVAEQWYKRSLLITEKHGNESAAAATYHQLGWIAQTRRDFTAAEQWYRRSLVIKERQGNRLGAASTYHQLGTSALTQSDFTGAENWYRRSLTIKEGLGDQHGAALTHGQLGILYATSERYPLAAQSLLEALRGFRATNDEHATEQVAEHYKVVHDNAPASMRPALKEMWRAAGLGDWPPPEKK